jgi:predicted nucleic acid-binding protein
VAHSDGLIVVDASAVLEFFTGANPDKKLRRRILTTHAAAPELLDVEVAHVLRRMAARGEISDADAEEALRDITEAPIARTPHRPLVSRIWELRHAVTAYDAAYVALAEALDAPLVTSDAKLAGSNGHDAVVELFPTSDARGHQ